METKLSLSHIDATVRKLLRRLDIASGGDYLSGVTRIIEPIREQLVHAGLELSELVLRAAVAEDILELGLINAHAIRSASKLFVSMNSVSMVNEICTVARDAIAERALELSRLELYNSGTRCTLPLALISVGSDGRRELSLIADQDYLFLYDSAADASVQLSDSMEHYFSQLGTLFSNKMEQAGISKCSAGIMPVNQEWRGSLYQWQSRISAMLRFEKKDWDKNIVNLIALMDARFVCGDRNIGPGFGAMVRSAARDNQMAIHNMARVVSSMKISRGFLRRFIVEADGRHEGEFNLKLMAWMPLVMCIRLMAVYYGIEETSTTARIRLLSTKGFFSDMTANDLTEAYHTVTWHRINQQVKKLKRVIDDDCYINPYRLVIEDRELLKKAMDSINELQYRLRGDFSKVESVDRLLSTAS